MVLLFVLNAMGKFKVCEIMRKKNIVIIRIGFGNRIVLKITICMFVANVTNAILLVAQNSFLSRVRKNIERRALDEEQTSKA